MEYAVKKLSLSLILLSLFSFAKAEDYQDLVIGPFGTLNNTDNSLIIPSTQAQDLLNVDLTPNGKSVKKRSGYGISNTLSITTSPVHGIYSFFDGSGNEVKLFFHDTRMTASVNGGADTVIFTNGPNGATYQCTDAEGYAYCANTQRSRIIKTDGSTSTNLVVVTTGTIVANTPQRMAQAGFASFPNRIDFSASNDFTNWVVGGLPTSPIQFTITSPGPRITHLTYAFNRIMWFKGNSFGYILEAPDLADWVVKTVSPNVGTLDNSSVYWNGMLYFRGQDSHFYAYDGSNLTKLSREITNTILLTQNRRANSWSQTSQSDWASGYDFTSVYIDTTTSSGDVQMTFPDTFSSFRDGTSGTKNVWIPYCKGLTPCTTNVASSSGVLTLTSTTGVSGQNQMIRGVSKLNNYKVGTTFYILLTSVTAASNTRFTFGLSSYSLNQPITSSLFNDYFYFQFSSTASNTIYLSQMKNISDGTICSGASCQAGNSPFPSSVSIFLSTTNYQVSIGNTVIKSGTHSHTGRDYIPYMDLFWGNAGTGIASIDTFGVVPQTATYYTAVKNAASLTSWDSFSATKQDNGGTHSFFIRSSTNVIQVNSSTPSWTSVSVGAIPSISTGSYFQIRDDFAITAATQAPVLSDITQSWFEGAAADKSYMTYFDDAVLFSVAYGESASSNNRILKYDLLNNGWLIYDFGANGFLTSNLSLYFGSPTSGYVFKYGDVDNDNGAAINSYWKSKDFFSVSPFIENDYRNMSLSASSVQNSSMTVTYEINGSSSTSFVFPAYTSNSSFTNHNRNLPQGKTGKEINVQFGNNAADQPYEVFAVKVGYTPKSWVPKP